MNIKSQLFEWVRQHRILMDVNNQDAYLLSESTQSNECKLLPAHIKKLVHYYLKQQVFCSPHKDKAFRTLHCDGMLTSEALFSSVFDKPKWVDARNIKLNSAYMLSSAPRPLKYREAETHLDVAAPS